MIINGRTSPCNKMPNDYQNGYIHLLDVIPKVKANKQINKIGKIDTFQCTIKMFGHEITTHHLKPKSQTCIKGIRYSRDCQMIFS